ncbi:MAG: hypothetical protein M3386_07015, partial [Actinomycetota bacterium]|nr:hypothetical protein [Actinomycetota bacterium]
AAWETSSWFGGCVDLQVVTSLLFIAVIRSRANPVPRTTRRRASRALTSKATALPESKPAAPPLSMVDGGSVIRRPPRLRLDAPGAIVRLAM